MKLVGLAGVVAAAVLGVLPVTVVTASPADADCGDPGQPACTGPVPTVEEVVGVLTKLTDPSIPCQDKADVVAPAFSADECGTIDDQLNHLNERGYMPFNFTVTDVQPAPDDFAGSTVSVVRPWTPPGPVVLVDQDGHWLITHDTAMTLLDALWHNHGRGGRYPYPGSVPTPYIPPLQVTVPGIG